MAIRGYKINDANIQKIIDEATTKIVHKYEKEGKSILKNIYDDAVKSWYAGSDGCSKFIKSTEYSTKISQSGDILSIICRARLDMNKYKKETSGYEIYNWFNRHKSPTPEKYSRLYHRWYPARNTLINGNSMLPQFYLANQVFNEGIIGLPFQYYKDLSQSELDDFVARHSKSYGYLTNPYFKQKEPLKNEIIEALKKKWANEISKI